MRRRWLRGALRELGRFISGSARSHRRQLEALAALDERLMRDIGLVDGRDGQMPGLSRRQDHVSAASPLRDTPPWLTIYS